MLRQDENPTEEKRSAADLQSGAPTLLWIMMAVVAVAIFALAAILMLSR